MTKTRAPQLPNINSESKAGSKKSICPGKSQIYKKTKMIQKTGEVIFHKRVRVYYQGLETRENNENRSGDGPSDFRCTRVFVKHE